MPVVRSVGEFIKSQVTLISKSDIETKERNSLVSYVDKTAEEKLVAALQVIYPEAGFITEENTVDQTKKDATWIIDPLDGTTNFLHQIPHYAVSVGLLVNGEIKMGLVLNAATDQCFYAWKDGGAYLNGNPIKVSETKDLSEAVIATGFPYRKDDVRPLIQTLTDMMRHARGLRRMGAAALDLVYVASGRFDCYYEAQINAWDIAAGIIIVREAGGSVSNYQGDNDALFGGQIIATNGSLHSELMEIMCRNFG